MKKFIVSIVLLLTTFYVGQFLVYHLLLTVSSWSNMRFVRVLNEPRELVVLGNSRAVNGVNERYWNEEFDPGIINASYNGMTPDVINALVEDLSEANKNEPLTFLIELTSFMKWDENRESQRSCTEEINKLNSTYKHDAFLPFRGFYPAIDSLYNSQYSANSMLRLLDFNSSTTYRILYYLFKKDDDWINSREITSAIIDDNNRISCIEFNFEQVHFERLLRRLDQQKREAIFFISPFHESFRDKFTNFEESIEHIERTYNIEINDLSDLDLEEDCYADGYHTNIKGSTVTTAQLHRVIIANSPGD